MRYPSFVDTHQARNIIHRAARESGFSVEDLVGPRRQAPLVWERHLAMAAIRRATGLSLNQIGLIFGGRDHSTVHHGIRRAEAAASWRPEVENLLADWSAF